MGVSRCLKWQKASIFNEEYDQVHCINVFSSFEVELGFHLCLCLNQVLVQTDIHDSEAMFIPGNISTFI